MAFELEVEGGGAGWVVCLFGGLGPGVSWVFAKKWSFLATKRHQQGMYRSLVIARLVKVFVFVDMRHTHTLAS